eukprot:TRINITY_DN33639_c0_g1_i1.p1 TRINITY_DN33639_c0_g1~~TRINITY_DN33639_c0_g1_i1.p1  ORF type:complete len:553 (+),score=159.65 TRINITY_DN33639_c0_g1_i1:298-1956(+)
MSWLSRSLSSSFREAEGEPAVAAAEEVEKDRGKGKGTIDKRGVKDDLSELTKSFKKQLWGVASFIAPPPPPPASLPKAKSQARLQEEDDGEDVVSGGGNRHYLKNSEPEHPDRTREETKPSLEGMRSDLAEISGSVKTGISRLALNLFPFKGHSSDADDEGQTGAEEEDDSDDEEEEEKEQENEEDEEQLQEEPVKPVVGITEEVLAFAKNISMHPETWLDFPLFSDDDDPDDFEMSDIQREHALAIERFTPRLAALKIELCPGLMSEGRFWKIYFVLLPSRLNKQDAFLLSTPQIVEARGLLMQELQKRTKSEEGNTGNEFSQIKGIQSGLSEEHEISNSLLDSEGKVEASKVVSMQVGGPIGGWDFHHDEQAGKMPNQESMDNDFISYEESTSENKNVLSGTSKFSDINYKDEEDNVDEWLEEEPYGDDLGQQSQGGLTNEDDVSFSDLEVEDDSGFQTNSANLKNSSDSSTKESKEWIQLSSSKIEPSSAAFRQTIETRSPSYRIPKGKADVLEKKADHHSQHEKKVEFGESNDWLTIEKDDVASADSS